MTDVCNIQAFLIPWYTHLVLKKYIFILKTNQAVFVKGVSQRRDLLINKTK